MRPAPGVESSIQKLSMYIVIAARAGSVFAGVNGRSSSSVSTSPVMSVIWRMKTLPSWSAIGLVMSWTATCAPTSSPVTSSTVIVCSSAAAVIVRVKPRCSPPQAILMSFDSMVLAI